MAYFRINEPAEDEQYQAGEEDTEEEYNDGFDELAEEEEEAPGLTDAERRERKQSRIRIAVGAGNLFSIIAGTVLILVMLTLIFSIVHFVINDMTRNFSLFQTNF